VKHLLGIDIGTTGAKTVVFDEVGTAVGTAFAPWPMAMPRPAWAEQDPHDWWTGVVTSVRDVLAASAIDPASIAGVGLSGQMHGLVLLDARREVLRPSIIWCDQRNDECGADNACAAVGNGVIRQGLGLVSIGSSGVALAPSERPRVDPGLRVHTFNHSVPGLWYLMGVTQGAGLSLLGMIT